MFRILGKTYLVITFTISDTLVVILFTKTNSVKSKGIN
jgi:hypothetical protein